MKDDFIEFMEGDEAVPANLNSKVRTKIQATINRRTLGKFYATNLLGAIITLTICPQYGFGPFGGEFGVIHYVMNLGPVWCGIFCAILFMAGGNLFSFFLLKDEERLWLSKHSMKAFFPWVSFLFFFGMIAKYYAPGSLHHDTLGYHMSWYFSALLFSIAFAKIWFVDSKTAKIGVCRK